MAAPRVVDKTIPDASGGADLSVSVRGLVDELGAEPVDYRAAREIAVRRLSSPELAQATEHTLVRFAPLLEPYPRALKRFVNAYGVERSLQILQGYSTSLEHARERLALSPARTWPGCAWTTTYDAWSGAMASAPSWTRRRCAC